MCYVTVEIVFNRTFSLFVRILVHETQLHLMALHEFPSIHLDPKHLHCEFAEQQLLFVKTKKKVESFIGNS